MRVRCRKVASASATGTGAYTATNEGMPTSTMSSGLPACGRPLPSSPDPNVTDSVFRRSIPAPCGRMPKGSER